MRTLTIAALGAAGLALVTGGLTATASGAPPATATATATEANGSEVITFYYGMQRPEEQALAALVYASDPESGSYREFPSRGRIADRYGARAKDVRTLRRSAARSGLSVSLDDTGVFARVTGTVDSMSDWLGEPIQRQASEDGSLVLYQAEGTPPEEVSSVVQEVVQYYVTLDTATATAAREPLDPQNEGRYIGGCEAAKEVNTYSFAQLQKAYGSPKGSQRREVGARTRLAIIADGSGYRDESLQAAADCFGTHGRSFKRVPIEGMTGDLPEGGEGDLDTQMAQSILPPGSKVKVIEASGYEADFLTWAKAFSLRQLPDAVTLSYGSCETQAGGTAQRAVTDSVLLRLGLAGTTATASSGDSGSSACFDPDAQEGPKHLAVNYPASSPNITAVGGSRIILKPHNKRKREVVWNLGGSPKWGGGGGQSHYYARPWWQPRGMTGSARRTLPDIAMHASNAPGWAVYVGDDVLQSEPAGFIPVGGTSASSPLFASSVAIFAAKQRRAGLPAYGHIAPSLYAARSVAPNTIYDIRSGTNDLFHKGCCVAKRGYDQASGLGAPNLDKLYGVLSRFLGTQGLG
ncbi:MAG: S8 family serine peptidase [Actinobacteria bacterium]|nr:S8 family serine peptidase [Actinomycetota bacterium]